MTKHNNEVIGDRLMRVAKRRIALSFGISGRELTDLTGCSPTTALKIIQEIRDAHDGLLVKTSKRWIVSNPGIIPAGWFGDESESAALTRDNECDVAIHPDDIPVRRIRFSASSAIADQAIRLAIRASRYRNHGAVQSGMMRIRYVGLRVGEQSKWRAIVPLALEEFSGRWRIIGFDTEADGVRTFQLSRILEVDESLHPIPGVTSLCNMPADPKRRVKVILSPELTEDQRIAAQNELGVDESLIREMTAGQLHDMRHQYGIDRPNESIVWPIVLDADFY